MIRRSLWAPVWVALVAVSALRFERQRCASVGRWRSAFGDMAGIGGLDAAEVDAIVSYVRRLQD